MIILVITVNHKYLFFKTGLILLLAIIIPVIIILRGVFILPIRLNRDDIRLGIFIWKKNIRSPIVRSYKTGALAMLFIARFILKLLLTII